MKKTNKILGIVMVTILAASAIGLTTARPIPEDCVSVVASNRAPEEVTVTSYYGDGTEKESFTIPAHYEGAPADGVQIHVPKNGKVGVTAVNAYLPAQNDKGQFLGGFGISKADPRLRSPGVDENGGRIWI
ncbi:MAG: hypothetical protein LBC39_02990 [Methanobrevibacter sp.]|jgi:hypothetical protein|nr:hypothetical protein [Candidatus Methanovirga aequatorialis]